MAKEKTIYLAIQDGKATTVTRSARRLAQEVPIGKSHIWFSRKFAENACFLFLFEDKSITFQKILAEV